MTQDIMTQRKGAITEKLLWHQHNRHFSESCYGETAISGLYVSSIMTRLDFGVWPPAYSEVIGNLFLIYQKFLKRKKNNKRIYFLDIDIAFLILGNMKNGWSGRFRTCVDLVRASRLTAEPSTN